MTLAISTGRVVSERVTVMPEVKEILGILKADLLGSVIQLRPVLGPDFVTKFRRAVTLLEQLDAALDTPPTAPTGGKRG